MILKGFILIISSICLLLEFTSCEEVVYESSGLTSEESKQVSAAIDERGIGETAEVSIYEDDEVIINFSYNDSSRGEDCGAVFN